MDEGGDVNRVFVGKYEGNRTLGRHRRKGKTETVPFYAQRCQECSKKLKFPDFMTTAQDDGSLSAFPTGRLYTKEILLYSFSYSLSRTQVHSAIGRIFNVNEKSNDTS